MPKTRKRNKKPRKETRQRNLVRGLVGNARSRTFEPDAEVKQVKLRNQLRRTLLSAREHLAPEQYGEYLSWLSLQTSTQLPASLNNSPIGFDFLNGIFDAAPVSFERELKWIATRLSLMSAEVSRFRTLADEMDYAFCIDDRPNVRRALWAISKEFGQSLWLIETRVAVLQQYGGLEAQKRYVSKIKKRTNRGVLQYVSHYVSVRNEPSTTPHRFADDLSRRIDRLSSTEPLKQYLKRRLIGEWPSGIAHLASILRIEQSHGLVDLYETFVATAQYLVSQQAANDSHRALLSDCINQLAAVKDWRLEKLAFHLGLERQADSIPWVSLSASDALFSGMPARAIRTAVRALRSEPRCVRHLVTIAYALIEAKRAEFPNVAPPWRFVIDQLIHVLGKDQEYDRAFADLTKYAQNFANLSSGRCLLGALSAKPILLNPVFDPGHYQWSLNSPYFEPQEMLSSRPSTLFVSASSLDRDELAASQTTRVMRIALRGDGGGDEIGTEITKLYTAAYHARIGDYERALNLIKTTSSSPLLQLVSCQAAVDVMLRAGHRDTAIELLTRMIVSYDHSASALPVLELADNIDWARYEHLAGNIYLPIFLDILWRHTNNDEVATLRRFAYDEFISRQGMSRPTELAGRVGSFNDAQLVYFLRYLCVPNIMDMSDAFGSSRELEEERRDICGLLCQLDPLNEKLYQDEIFEISNKLVIQDGLKLVDSSRVYVDIDAISRWAEGELKEDFSRYADLVTVGIGIADDFDVVVKSLLRLDAASTLLTIPENQADDLLVGMITDLRDRFISDSAHGLDSYLSKRVRHGSIPNHLRSPVETSSLITQRDSTDDKYKRNDHWLDRFIGTDPQWLTISERAFAQFARDFDSIILSLKDDLLQIKSEEHPHGMFEIKLTAPAIHLIRSGVQTDLTFDGFLRSCYAVFWGVLEHSLRQIRYHLRTTTKNQFTQAFDELRADLLVLSESLNFPQLSMAIGDASAEVQRQAEAVAEWFQKSEGRQGAHSYTLHRVAEIAVASALKAMRAFLPEVRNDVTERYRVQANGLVLISEIVWALFENVRRHSGIEKSPWIIISAEVDEENETISFSFRSEVAKEVKTPEAERKLAALRSTIADGTYKARVAKESNSGLIKIASVVSQSTRGRLAFGFAPETEEFYVNIDLSFVFRRRLQLTSEEVDQDEVAFS